MKNLFLCLGLAVVFLATTPVLYANTSESRTELINLSEQVIQLMLVRAELKKDTFEEDEIEELRSDIASLADDEVAEILLELKEIVVFLNDEIAHLREFPPEKKEPPKVKVPSELETLRSQFFALYSRCDELFRAPKLTEWFEKNPCLKFAERVRSDVDQENSEDEILEVYKDGVQNLTQINKQLRVLSDDEISRIKQSIELFDANHQKVILLISEHKKLGEAIDLLNEKLQDYDNRAGSYVDDASLDCRAEQVDFDCGNRCEIQVRDPIFGTYKNEPDFQCLNHCNRRERQARDDLYDQVQECEDERDTAREKLEDISTNFESARARGERMSNRYDKLGGEIQELISANQSINNTLLPFFGDLNLHVGHYLSEKFFKYYDQSREYAVE